MQLSRSPQDPARFNVAPWLWKGVGMLCLLSAVGCGGGGSSGGSPTPVVTPTPVVSPTPVASPTPTTNAGTLYVSAPGPAGTPGQVFAYPAAASGSPAPSYTLSSNDFNSPGGLATDSNGALYVLNFFGLSSTSSNIVIFAKGATTPTKTISSSAMPGPETAIAVDYIGNMYVVGQVAVSGFSPSPTYGVAVFGPSASGTGATPLTTFTNPGSYVPTGIAVDSAVAPNIYVASEDANVAGSYNAIQVFRNGSSGNAPPAYSITGSATELGQGGLNGVALDTAGNVYASLSQNTGSPTSIVVFPAGTTGNTPPGRVITGSATMLANPSFMAFDSSGDLYVQNSPSTGNPYVTVYPPNATGAIAPIRVIQEAAAQGSRNNGIAVGIP